MTGWTALALLLSFVLGSVPTGLWVGLWIRRIDIREHGSRNIGATNTLRVLGARFGALALAGDVGKGALAALVVARVSGWAYAPLACGAAAIAGHTFSVFCRFRGGKGVATSAGVFLALCPLPTLIAAAVFAVVVAVGRMVSAGSIAAALAMAGMMAALPHDWVTYPTHAVPDGWALRAVAISMAALVIARHRANIKRLLRGQELRF